MGVPAHRLPSPPARCYEVRGFRLTEVLDGWLYALVVEPNGITGVFMNDLPRPALPPVSEGVFDALPV